MIFLHIGTHKTGSKSLQRFLLDHHAELAARGYDLYSGCYQNPTNHRELLVASLRFGRDSFTTHNEPARVADGGHFVEIAAHVQKFLKNSRHPHQIFSSEDLSHLRFPEEFARLKALLNVPPSEICVIVYLRNKDDFRRSYCHQIEQRRGRSISDDPDSAFYVEDDSWLFDYDSLVARYRQQLGCKVIAIDYDAAVADRGNIIPSFLDVLGVPGDALPWNDYFLHRSNSVGDTRDRGERADRAEEAALARAVARISSLSAGQRLAHWIAALSYLPRNPARWLRWLRRGEFQDRFRAHCTAFMIAGSGAFDPVWYRMRYPDVKRIDPLLHYVLFGAVEGRNPTPFFTTRRYLRANPELTVQQTSPLLHYLRHHFGKERA